MKQHTLRAFVLVAAVTALALSINIAVNGQSYGKVKSQMTSQGSASLTARLIDPLKKAKEKAATVQVTVRGVALIDPAVVKERPRPGQGHLHYRVDEGPVIATTSTKLSFHELTPGQHRIVVMLAGNDHTPLGPQETLTVTIP